MNLPNYLRKKRGLLQIRKDGGWDVWNPYHSKLSAYLVAGGKNWPFKKNSRILYLGSAEGNTINYLSEISKTNSITAVEISPVAMAELLVLAKKKITLFHACVMLIFLKNIEFKQITLK